MSKGKVILITGGCQGLGKEIATKLCKENTVIISSNREESLCETAKELKCEYLFCDITNPEQVQQTIKSVVEKNGKIDVLINNAGIYVAGELDDSSYQEIAQVMLVNSVGTMNMTKAVIPYMKKQKSGKIVNVVSVNGIETKIDRSIYIASKWAITGFTDALRKELQQYGIGVYGIFPGLMKTHLFDNAHEPRDLSEAMETTDVAKIVEFALSLDSVVFEKMVFRSLESTIA